LPRVRAHWVRPEVVVQVSFIEWTVHGKLRHSRLRGLRADKSPRDVVRETP
jgi:ATP-dependent DNA ligase